MPQCVVPTFHVIDLPTFFANAVMRFFWEDVYRMKKIAHANFLEILK